MPVLLQNSSSLTLSAVTQYTDYFLTAPTITSPDTGEERAAYKGQLFTVGWDTVADADFYVVQVSMSADFRGATTFGYKVTSAGAGGSGTDSYDFSYDFEVGVELRIAKTHYFRVFAYSNEGCVSPASDVVTLALREQKFPDLEDSSQAESGSSGGTGTPSTGAPTPTGGSPTGGGATDDPCDDFTCSSNDIILTSDRTPAVYNNQVDTHGSIYAAFTLIVPSGCDPAVIAERVSRSWSSNIPNARDNSSTEEQYIFFMDINTPTGVYTVTERLLYEGSIVCSNSMSIEIVGEEPPVPTGGYSTDDCQFTLADGCYDFAIITEEQADCYVLDRLPIKFINGAVYLGNSFCQSETGGGCP